MIERMMVLPGVDWVVVSDMAALLKGKEVELGLVPIGCEEPTETLRFTARFDCEPFILGRLSDGRPAVLTATPACNQYFLRVGENPMKRLVERSRSRHNEEYPEPVVGPLQAPCSVRV